MNKSKYYLCSVIESSQLRVKTGVNLGVRSGGRWVTCKEIQPAWTQEARENVSDYFSPYLWIITQLKEGGILAKRFNLGKPKEHERMCKLVDGDVFPKVPANPSKKNLKPAIPVLRFTKKIFFSATANLWDEQNDNNIFIFGPGPMLFQISLLTGTQVVAPSPRALSSQKSDKEILKVLKNIWAQKLHFLGQSLKWEFSAAAHCDKIFCRLYFTRVQEAMFWDVCGQLCWVGCHNCMPETCHSFHRNPWWIKTNVVTRFCGNALWGG